MFFGSNIVRECERRNRANRNVNEYATTLSLPEFWSVASRNNFLINGGNDALRDNILASAMQSLCNTTPYPTIVLNGSEGFENRMISMAKQNLIGRLTVTSPKYNNYNLFCSLNSDDIIDLVQKEARERGMMNIDRIGDYAAAFIDIFQLKYPMNFRGLLAMGKQNDVAIKNFGSYHGADGYTLDIIESGTEAGRNFRMILNAYRAAFANIHCNENTNFNLASISSQKCTYIIWARSQFQRCFNLEIATELKKLRNRGVKFNLILNNISFEHENDELASFIQSEKNSIGVVGITCKDAVAMQKGVDFNNGLCAGMGTMLVLKSYDTDTFNLESVLGRFGKYLHFEVTTSVDKPKGIHAPWTGTKHKNMVTHERARVTANDMQPYAIAVRGHMNDTVGLYRSYTF